MTVDRCTVINGLNTVTMFSFTEKTIMIDHFVYGERHIQ